MWEQRRKIRLAFLSSLHTFLFSHQWKNNTASKYPFRSLLASQTMLEQKASSRVLVAEEKKREFITLINIASKTRKRHVAVYLHNVWNTSTKINLLCYHSNRFLTMFSATAKKTTSKVIIINFSYFALRSYWLIRSRDVWIKCSLRMYLSMPLEMVADDSPERKDLVRASTESTVY